MKLLIIGGIAAISVAGFATPARAATYNVSYVVTSNQSTATVQFDSQIQNMQLRWSNMDNTYSTSKRFQTNNPTGLLAKIYGGTQLSCRIRVNGEVVVSKSSSSVASCNT